MCRLSVAQGSLRIDGAKWLEVVSRAVSDAKEEEQKQREESSRVQGMRGLLGNAVLDATKPFEQVINRGLA